MTRPRKDQVEDDLDLEKRGKAAAKVEEKIGTVPKAQGDLVAEMVLQEDDEEIVPLIVGQLLPPAGNHFEEPHPVERRIAKSAHSI